MDALCLKAGIHGITAPPIDAAGNMELRMSAAAAEMPSSPSAAPLRNFPWGFTFRRPLRSLWPAARNKIRLKPAIAEDDAVLAETDDIVEGLDETATENWVSNVLRFNLLRNGEEKGGNCVEEEKYCVENEECDSCAIDDDDEKIEFDRESFSKLLRKVSLAESRLYAQLSYLGSLAYCIPKIKPGNLLRNYKMKMVTSSLEKKELALKIEREKELTLNLQNEAYAAAQEGEDVERNENGEAEGIEEAVAEGNRVSSAAYHIAASAASYFHSHTKIILRFKSSQSKQDKNCVDNIASLMATTDTMTAVVSAEENVKQAMADVLISNLSSPCEWFICDDDETATRFFVIQGSESLASWKANLFFEPIQFEGLDVLVHRGIYEAAKGIYEHMLPAVHSYLETHKDHAKFRFTGHSLGGSLSVLVNLMLLIRRAAPRSSLLPVITYGAPSIMCGGDRLLLSLRLPRNHVRSITMHRDIVPRAFSCNYPNHVAEFLKAVNGNFRNHPCLDKQKILYTPMGELLILQPDENFSPHHDLLPAGSGLYLLTAEAEKQLRAAQAMFLNSPHPLEILRDRSAYGSEGSIQRDHDMLSYLKSLRNVIRHDLNRVRKARRERRKVRWLLVASSSANAGVIVSRPVGSSNKIGQGKFNLSGMVGIGRESIKRFSTLVASQHMHLLLVVMFPARLLVLGNCGSIGIS